MKAVIITQPGAPEVLQTEERLIPNPAAGEVLIRVYAAGINRPDVAQRQGRYPAPAGAPADIPGLEVAGVVESCGASVVRWKPGDKVCALLAGGGYSEYALAPEGQCLPVPEGISFAEAASLPETVFTVWHNVFQRGRLQAGESLLVHGGSSGIGITAIQLAKAFGCRVFVTVGTQEKADVCKTLGAEKCVLYNEEDFEKELQSEGVDVILDMIGGDYVPKNIRLLKEEGRMVFINAMKGADMTLSIRDIMVKRLTITGSTLRSREVEFKAQLAEEIEKNVWPLLTSKAFKPVIYQTFPLASAAKAHELMESSNHIGKIVLIVKDA